MKKILFFIFLVCTIVPIAFSKNSEVLRKPSILSSLQSRGALTFYKAYSNTATVNADYSVGSATGTFAATRDATTPATYINSSKLIQIVTTADTPRFTAGYYGYSGYVAHPGLLIEGAASNGISDSYFSQTFATYWRLRNSAETVGSSTDYSSPVSGATKIAKLVATSSSEGLQTSLAKKVSTTLNSYYTISAYLRGSGDVYLFYDNSGTVLASSKITLKNNDWYFYSFTFKSLTSATGNLGVILKENNNVTCYLGGIQLEAGKFSSSFIPTTTAALTRNSETLSYVTSGNRTADTESLLISYIPFSGNENIASSILIDSDTKSRKISDGSANSNYVFLTNETDSATSKSTGKLGSIAYTDYVVAAIAYGPTEATNSEIYIDGYSSGTNTTNYTSPAYGTNFYIGSDNAGANQVNGIIKNVAIFSNALTALNARQASNSLSIYSKRGLPPENTIKNIIIDSDFSSDCDDVAALTLLLRLEQQGELNILGMVNDTTRKVAAYAMDATTTYYGRSNIPFGQTVTGVTKSDSYATYLAQNFTNSLYPSGTPVSDIVTLRTILASRPDNSVSYLSIGVLRSLYNLYNSPADSISPLTGVQLMALKLKEIFIMGGDYPTGVAESNFASDQTATQVINSITANLPGMKVIYLGYTLGHSIITDVTNASTATPVSNAFFQQLGAYTRYSWDPLMALFSTRELRYKDDSYFTLSAAGSNSITGGDNTFTVGSGNQYYVINQASIETLGRRLSDLVSELE